jgi:predicted transcriptional regulator
MSQTLTIELSDEVFAAIQHQAEQAHTSPARLAASSLEEQFDPSRSLRRTELAKTEAELQAARERVERHSGAVDLGYATGADNESIDADVNSRSASAPYSRSGFDPVGFG